MYAKKINDKVFLSGDLSDKIKIDRILIKMGIFEQYSLTDIIIFKSLYSQKNLMAAIEFMQKALKDNFLKCTEYDYKDRYIFANLEFDIENLEIVYKDMIDRGIE
jgi:hypothetical protein